MDQENTTSFSLSFSFTFTFINLFQLFSSIIYTRTPFTFLFVYKIMPNYSKKMNGNHENTTAVYHHRQQSNDNDCIRASSSSIPVKRPRAPIACFRCHHKKVRCDGVHPSCTRCASTGILCAYPTSRRSRTTQPTTNIDPYINNLSHLEDRIRRIESDMENQRVMIQSIIHQDPSLVSNDPASHSQNTSSLLHKLASKMLHTESEVQDSRSILAQLRLRGEQRILRNKRKAAKSHHERSNTKLNTNKIKKQENYCNTDPAKIEPHTVSSTDPTYFQDMMIDQADMDWMLFAQQQQQQQQQQQSLNGMQDWSNHQDPAAYYTLLPVTSHQQQSTDNALIPQETVPFSTTDMVVNAANHPFVSSQVAPTSFHSISTPSTNDSNTSRISSTTTCSSSSLTTTTTTDSCDNPLLFAIMKNTNNHGGNLTTTVQTTSRVLKNEEK
ncbi:MAG: hypothetical protein EXX96DRAFT_585840 [Benjaminiella poitrasii]|nr:MAG: hypothetical protein EXX96DRAFT_585840 [Benjaminiella poitrasii]